MAARARVRLALWVSASSGTLAAVRRFGLACLLSVLGCAPVQSGAAPSESPAVATAQAPREQVPPCAREGFSVGDPTTHGIAPEAVQAFVARAKAEHSTALIIAVDGTIVVEEYFGQDPDRATIAMSVTKSIVAVALGIAVAQGWLALDEPLAARVIPEWASTDKAAITLRHLLTQTSGLDPQRYAQVDGDWANGSIEAHALTCAVTGEPGTSWVYNNNGIDLLSVVVRRAHPEHLYLDDFLQAGLFAELGVVGAYWIKDGHGMPRAAGELVMRPIDLAKIGQLVLDEGRWNGEAVVDPAWVRQLVTPVDVARFYGLSWWLRGDASDVRAWAANGYLGQHIVVVPQARVVAVRTRNPALVGAQEGVDEWNDFAWDVLALVGEPVAEADRNAFARPRTP